MDNKLLEYIEDYIYFQTHRDKEGLEALKEEGREKYVTMEEVGEAIYSITSDLAKYSDTSQAIMEARVQAIVECLPKTTQNKIYKQFEDAEDDLFILEGEEINYDKEE